MVLLKYRSVVIKQVLAEQLWIQVPNISHVMSHDGLFIAELHCYFLAEDRAFTEYSVEVAILEDFFSWDCVLLLGCGWKHLA